MIKIFLISLLLLNGLAAVFSLSAADRNLLDSLFLSEWPSDDDVFGEDFTDNLEKRGVPFHHLLNQAISKDDSIIKLPKNAWLRELREDSQSMMRKRRDAESADSYDKRAGAWLFARPMPVKPRKTFQIPPNLWRSVVESDRSKRGYPTLFYRNNKNPMLSDNDDDDVLVIGRNAWKALLNKRVY